MGDTRMVGPSAVAMDSEGLGVVWAVSSDGDNPGDLFIVGGPFLGKIVNNDGHGARCRMDLACRWPPKECFMSTITMRP